MSRFIVVILMSLLAGLSPASTSLLAQGRVESLPVLGAISIPSPQHLAMSGRHAYVANATGVHVYDITHPSEPEFLGTYEIPDPTDIAVGEGRVHIVNDDGLWVFPEGEEFSVDSHFVPMPGATHVEYPAESGYNNSIWVTYGREPVRLSVTFAGPDGTLTVPARYNEVALTEADGEPTDIQFVYGYVFVSTTTHVIRFHQASSWSRRLTLDTGPSNCLATDLRTKGMPKFLFVCGDKGDIWGYYFPELYSLDLLQQPMETAPSGLQLSKVNGTPRRMLFQDHGLIVAHSNGLDAFDAYRWPSAWAQLSMQGIRDIAIGGNTLLVAHSNEVQILRWRWGEGKTVYLPIAAR